MGPSEGSIEEPLTVLAELKRQGLIRHLGLSNVSPEQLAEAQTITEIVCVQNLYNVAHRNDDGFIDDLAGQGIAYVPFFPLGGFSPLQSSAARRSSSVTAGDADAGRTCVASSALAQHPADPRHIVTSNIFARISMLQRCNFLPKLSPTLTQSAGIRGEHSHGEFVVGAARFEYQGGRVPRIAPPGSPSLSNPPGPL